MKLGELAISCVCDLLISHPYFNYNKNIVQMLTPFLNNRRESIRQAVVSCYSAVFKDDKRGEITIEVRLLYFF